MKLSQAGVRISRTTSTDPLYDDTFEVSITDELSGCVMASARVKPEALALALAGSGAKAFDVFFNDSGNIGKKSESKEEVVYVKYVGYDKDKMEAHAKAALLTHEVDGWKARISDFHNSHRHIKTTKEGQHYRVVFYRYVDAGEAQ